MIGSVKGKITFKNERFLVVETGGIGFRVNISPDALLQARIGEEISLWTHTHVREDSIELYGFAEYRELSFFELLISISGIGPKSAIGILGIASQDTLEKAVRTGDTAYLTKVSGIGRKTAEKIILELRDKLGEEEGGTALKEELDALEALKSLGYSQAEARDALKKASGANTNAKIKEALKILGGR